MRRGRLPRWTWDANNAPSWLDERGWGLFFAVNVVCVLGIGIAAWIAS